MITALDKMIGSGIAFPLESSPINGMEISSSIERINQSLFIILSTRKGSRLMLPDFGSSLSTYRFDPYDKVLVEKIRETLFKDIAQWEPRISVTSINCTLDDVSVDSHTLYINLEYNIRNTDVSGNFVYPFKLSTYDTTVESAYDEIGG